MNRDKSRVREFFDNRSDPDLRNRAVRAAGATVLAGVVGFLIYFISTVILARILVPEDFGLVLIVLTISIPLANFGVRGFTEATIQDKNITHEKISALFWIHVICNLTLGVLFMASAPLIAWLYDDSRLVAISVVISSSIILDAVITQHAALLTRRLYFYKLTAVRLLASLVSSGLAIYLAWTGWEYWALVARRVVGALLLVPLVLVVNPWIPGLPKRHPGVWSMVKFALNTYGNYITNYFSRSLDKMLLGWYSGTTALAHYDKAYYVFTAPANQLSSPLTSVAVATLSKIRDDHERFRHYYFKALSTFALIGMPTSAAVILLAPDIIYFLLGPQWELAGEILRIFGAGVAALLIYGTHGWLHLSLGTPHHWFRWGIFELAVVAAALLAGLPFGAKGVAVAYTIAVCALVGPGLLYAGRPIRLRLSELVAILWPFFVRASIAGVVSWWLFFGVDAIFDFYLGLNSFLRLAVCSAFLLSIYGLLVLASSRTRASLFDSISLARQMIPTRSKKALRDKDSQASSTPRD